MSDRSDEATRTREPASTDELLEETEQLLSGGERVDVRGDREPDARSGRGEDVRGGRERDRRDDREGESGSRWRPFSGSASDDAAGTETSSRSRTGSLLARLSPTQYFSPKAFLALVLVVGTGVVGGGTVLPAVGRLLGMFAVAFLVGLVTSKRRYLEVAAAGTAVGAVAAFFDYAVLSLVGVGGNLLAVGTAAGAVGCLLGYYFGRDLRAGLSREL